MDYLFDEVIGDAKSLGSVHHFVWDRTRAIRNDFSIQQLSRTADLRIAIECYEKIARFHILSLHQLALKTKPYDKYDWYQEREQLDRTLLSLMQYYDDSREQIHSPHEAEFRAYCIIFQIQSPIPDMEDRVQTWPQHILLNMRVQKALELYASACNVADAQGPLKPRAPHAIAQANWEKFWTLIKSNETSYLMSCVAEIYFNLIRRTALIAIWKASRQGVKTKVDGWTIAKLVKVLGFDKVRQVEDFCAHYGFSIERGDDGKRFLDLNSVRGRNIPQPASGMKEQIKSEKIVEVKRHGRTLPAVIKGLSVGAAQAADLMETRENINGQRPEYAEKTSSTKKQSKRVGHNTLRYVEDDATDSDTLFVGQDPPEKEQYSQTAPHVLTNGIKFGATAEVQSLQNINGNDNMLENRTNRIVKPASSIFPFKNAVSEINGVTSFGKPSALTSNVNSPPPKPLLDSSENSAQESKESPSLFKNNQSPSNLFKPNQTSYTKAAEPNLLKPASVLSGADLGTNDTGRKSDQPPVKFNFEASQFPGKSFEFSGFDKKADDSQMRSPFSAPAQLTNEIKSTDTFPSTVQNPEENGKGLDFKKLIPKDATLNESFNFIKPDQTTASFSSARPSFAGNSPVKTGSVLQQPVASVNIPPAQQKQQTFLGDKNLNLINSNSNNNNNNNNNNNSITATAADPSINENQPISSKPTTNIFETQRKAFDNLAKHMILNAETGFLTQFIEYTIGPLISDSIKQVAQERLYQRAIQFRHNWLAARYGRAWKEVAWHLKLARQGRKRRARIAQKREERARLTEGKAERDVRDFEDLIRNGIGERRESRVSRRRKTNKVGTKEESQEDEGSWKGDRSKEDGLEHHTKKIGETHKREDIDNAWERPRTKQEELPQNSFHNLGFSMSNGLERKSTTKTNYFRLKALGIQPQGQNLWDRPRIKPNSSPSPSPSPSPSSLSTSASAAQLPGRTSMSSMVKMAPPPMYSPSRRSLMTSSKITTSNGKHTVKKKAEEAVDDTSAARRGVKRRNSYMSDAEQQDEALFARLRAAKEALKESISFFQEEMAMGNAAAANGGNAGNGDNGRRWDRVNDNDKYTEGSAASYLST